MKKNPVHLKSIQIWFSKQSQNLKTVDKLQKIEILKEESYWREVLHRLVETIKFLSTRGLAFRGDDQTLGSCHNGNYLGFIELLAKFDPFLSTHINKYANKGTGNVSYLSNTVCDELILAMSKTILDKIIQEIKISKYFSIIVDSTPDMSKIDQLTVAVRYTMLDGSPVEHFLGSLPSVGHKAEEMDYDNAQNMAGIYNGLQARIKKKSPTAEFVPCSAHSLNLVGTFAAEATSIGNRFFMTTQNLYTFFSGSTSRWKILENQLKDVPNSTLLKNLCPTRWSSRYAVCKSIKNGYPGIIAALQEISKDISQRPATIYEAIALNKKIENLEFIFMLVLWTPILERFNMTSKSLQFVDIDLNNFDILLNEAMCICKKDMFPNESKRQSRRTVFFDEDNAEETVFTEKIDNTDLRVKAEILVKTYEEDLDADFIEEVIQFKAIFSCMPENQKTSIHILFKALTTSPIITTFPSIEIALKIFRCLPCSNSSGERSFSVLKRVKTYLQSSLSNEKISQLSVLFAKGKARKKLL
ncbi:zinc finger MYM-type protein 1-like [Melanaphis sacchari]|uniref:zinc finger MYM-type protein 1-like n=1 Tax=Melanaphis sacchari TaxID=742174 RepID=UPI000DC14F95|nr:zinc finger MYM-type protein 1-like [Melanaphis sacchari]